MKLTLKGGFRNQFVTEGAKLGYQVSAMSGHNFYAIKGKETLFCYPKQGETMEDCINRTKQEEEAKKNRWVKSEETKKKFPAPHLSGMSAPPMRGKSSMLSSMALMAAISAGFHR